MSEASRDELDDLGYSDALAELEQILAELEDELVDVDVLADRVARASRLIQLCRSRITAARVQVDRIVAELEQAADGREPGDGDDGDDQPSLL